ncbi:MAG: cytochrome c [Gammaproteobacteria bacterium]
MRILVGVAALALSCANVNRAWGYEPVVNYQLHCMGCHLADGSGQSGRVPSIRRTLVLFSQSAQGRDYVARVPGVAQSPLSNEDTAMLLNWMARNLSDLKLPAGFRDYSAAEIKGLRAHPLVTVKPLRARLLRTSLAPPVAPPSAPPRAP